MWEALAGAAGKIIGGIFGQNEAANALHAQQVMAQNNINLQREFAQHGIQWKVEDAKRAGIHPIYALGGSGASFTPVSANFTADTSMANAFAGAGQDIGRAIQSTRTAPDRADAFAKTSQALSIERQQLENENLKLELASKTGRLRQAGGQGPPFPSATDPYLIPGQAESGLIKPKPLEVAPGHPAQPQSEGGAISDVGYARTKTGWAPVPSKDVKERIEDQIIPELLWSLRNNVLPSFGMNTSPPPFKAPPGKAWHFDVPTQEYRLKPANTPWYRRGFDVRID